MLATMTGLFPPPHPPTPAPKGPESTIACRQLFSGENFRSRDKTRCSRFERSQRMGISKESRLRTCPGARTESVSPASIASRVCLSYLLQGEQVRWGKTEASNWHRRGRNKPMASLPFVRWGSQRPPPLSGQDSVSLANRLKTAGAHGQVSRQPLHATLHRPCAEVASRPREGSPRAAMERLS